MRHGDSSSPLLYVLCVEVLASLIRSSPGLEGFLLPGAKGLQARVLLYTDDTTVILRSLRTLTNLFNCVSVYENGSGAKLNLSKTKAMWLGGWGSRSDEPLGLTWIWKMKDRAPVDQLVEHRAVTREVVSSTPAGPTLRVFK